MFLFSVVGRRYSGAGLTIGRALMLVIRSYVLKLPKRIGEDTRPPLVVQRFGHSDQLLFGRPRISGGGLWAGVSRKFHD